MKPNLVIDLQVDDPFDDLQKRSSNRITADAAASSTTKSTGASSSKESQQRRGGGCRSVVDIPDNIVDRDINVIAVIAFVRRVDESGLIDEDEEGHEELAVEPISQSAVSGDDCANAESPFETKSEEAAERRDLGTEDGNTIAFSWNG